MNNETPEHAGFTDRFLASIIDSIIIGGLSFAINQLNFTTFKSFGVYLIFALIGMAYKPYFESRYKATLGKMVMKMEVTDLNYNYIDFNKSIMRSLILIVPAIAYIIIHFFAFNNPYVLDSNGVIDFGTKMGEEYPFLTLIATVLSYATLVDVIVYLVDLNKQQRSLKDFIAKTYVIKKEK
ncbi:RDD family protein [Dokdonia ponticola]|uniref:RDD family protein n=1 Tax=Dokdonia ponticola TaxID=2041041 RepID=A0ABV9I1C9_9FLAO